MRLLLDEHLSPIIAIELRAFGYDVVAIAGTEGWMGADDAAVLRRALDEHRAIVTANVGDFRALANERISRGQSHPGLILLPTTYRRRRADVGRLVEALNQLLSQHPGDEALQDREYWLR